MLQGVPEFDALEVGAWGELPGGGYVWRLRITSLGASSQMLVFRFGAWAQLSVCREMQTHADCPCTA